MNFVKIGVSALGTLVSLFVFTKIMGNREMSQLSMFDYISSITVGSIAGEMAVMSTDSFWEPFVAMSVFSVLSMLVSYATCKSMKLRRLLGTQVLLLYQEGQIYEKNLLKAKLDINEFLAACRLCGYYDLEEVHTVFLEANGTISVLPLSLKRPVTPADLKLTPTQCKPLANVIVDGNILYDNLKSTGKDDAWLKNQLTRKGISDIRDIILATFDASDDSVNLYRKSHGKVTRDIFQ